jgi:hypothetical protein
MKDVVYGTFPPSERFTIVWQRHDSFLKNAIEQKETDET